MERLKPKGPAIEISKPTHVEIPSLAETKKLVEESQRIYADRMREVRKKLPTSDKDMLSTQITI